MSRLLPCLAWLLVAPVQALVDYKCFVRLDNGDRVVLLGPVTSEKPANIHRAFMTKGYASDGGIRRVSEVLECTRSETPFRQGDARRQEQAQPR